MIYLIGSLKNPKVPLIAQELRTKHQLEVFDQWYAAGPEADDYHWAWAKARGWGIRRALKSFVAQHIFEFDKHHIDRATSVVLVMPAGKSGHLEFGYAIGRGKPGYILFDKEPDKLDVMWQFATGVAMSIKELIHLANMNGRGL